jgi:hypothetical protein
MQAYHQYQDPNAAYAGEEQRIFTALYFYYFELLLHYDFCHANSHLGLTYYLALRAKDVYIYI